MIVALRAARSSDATWIESWLVPMAASVGFDPHDAGELFGDTSRNMSVILRDRRTVGLVVHRLTTPGTAIIEFVGTAPGEARRGSGMQAAALLEHSLSKRGVRSMYAPAPEIHGIAMYFWIRLGYRPLLREQWPIECDGVAWLRRDLAAARNVRRTAASRGSR